MAEAVENQQLFERRDALAHTETVAANKDPRLHFRLSIFLTSGVRLPTFTTITGTYFMGRKLSCTTDGALHTFFPPVLALFPSDILWEFFFLLSFFLFHPLSSLPVPPTQILYHRGVLFAVGSRIRRINKTIRDPLSLFLP
ncbi:uncharacterized protein PgNI_01524, partial [Pyricularia grisea]|uniref:Uncharacterized protein n=1 Tax=Pyricularia grisea TaxID=148305 RepID=A0A6P8BLP7_PYRGI